MSGDSVVFRFPVVHRNILHAETTNKNYGNVEVPTIQAPKDDEEPTINPQKTDYSPWNIPSKILVSMLSPTHICGQNFVLTIDNNLFCGVPTMVETMKEEYDQEDEPLTMFHLVFCLKRDSPNSFIQMCQMIAAKITLGLNHEQNRCRYVSKEVKKMFDIKAVYNDKVQQWQNSSRNNGRRDSSMRPTREELTKNLLNASSLAVLIEEIFYGIRERGYVNSLINNWLYLSLTVKNPTCHPNIPIRPYQTLLLFGEDGEVKRNLPINASPALRKLIDVAKPTKSFMTLQNETGLSLTQLFRIASHLVYWGKAKVIDTLTKKNVYILNPDCKSSFSDLRTSFLEHFKEWNLADRLKGFSIPIPLKAHITSISLPNAQREFVNIVIWLLRHELLIEVHTFVYLLLPPSISKLSSIGEVDEGYYLSPTPLKEHEEQYLDQWDDGSKEHRLFRRLCPYFHGRHHTREIQWQQNIEREELDRVLTKYSRIVITVDHNVTN
eukprot:TRINITY_DN6593_c0_g1_i1.p1 TRINITY_DN6593_c0_g1~~TRINITY_DN6593_c0_g1_i1.p1  ORF type:complete len:523 (-),score=87.05 TRINITY_DN6593_c0_g1_i1:22-1503(-)